jgi:putative transposase
MGKKRMFTSEFKTKLVLEVLREERTAGEIAADNNINPNQLSNWKQEFLAKAPRVFDETKEEKAHAKALKEAEEEKEMLLKKVGQLTMERDFLQAVQSKQHYTRGLL